MVKSGFSKVSGSAKKLLYGQRGALVCGYGAAEQDVLLAMLERWNLSDVPVVFAGMDDAERPVAPRRCSEHAIPRLSMASLMERQTGSLRTQLTTPIRESARECARAKRRTPPGPHCGSHVISRTSSCAPSRPRLRAKAKAIVRLMLLIRHARAHV